MDALFADLDKPGRPGAAIGIYQGGRAEYLKGYGYADLEQGTRITPETVFNLASVSKHFTAFAIALLAREGKIDLDEDVRTYLPYMPDFGKRVTVNHLIHHTSGLRTSEILFELGGQEIGGTAHQAQIPNLASRQRELNFEPGSEYLYCNLAYSLLPEIVKAVSGRSFREFTTERMFKPLGMAHTLAQDDATEIIPKRAPSYESGGEGKPWVRSLENYDVIGATGLMTSVQDLMKWAANFTHPVVGDARLIEQMGTTGKLNDGTPINYAFGLTREKYAGHEALAHTGSSAGYRTLFAYFPKKDFAVAILMNSPGDRDGPLQAIADLYLNGGPGTLPVKPTPVAPRADVMQAALGHYLSEYGAAVEISRDGDKLALASGGGSKTPLAFRKDGTFDLGRGGDEYYRFVRNAKQITGIEQIMPDGRPQHPAPSCRAGVFTPSPTAGCPRADAARRRLSQPRARHHVPVQRGERQARRPLDLEQRAELPTGARQKPSSRFRNRIQRHRPVRAPAYRGWWPTSCSRPASPKR